MSTKPTKPIKGILKKPSQSTNDAVEPRYALQDFTLFFQEKNSSFYSFAAQIKMGRGESRVQ